MGSWISGQRLLAVTATALTLFVAGCGDDEDPGAQTGAAPAAPAAEKLKVVASTTHLADIARQVGGDAVQVVGLLQSNSDPHDYEPRPDDIKAVTDADVFLISGFGLDDWTGEVAENSGAGDKVVDVGGSSPVKRADPEEEFGPNDPHWWQDPKNLAAASTVVRDAIAKTRPDAKDAVSARAKTFADAITALDAQAAECFTALPAAARKLVTDHDAFGYLADHYDLEVVGTVIPSLSSQAQPSAGDLAELAQTIEREDVKAVFPESALEPRLADAIAKRTGVSSDFSLFSDALGPDGSEGSTVLGAYASNARELVRGMSAGQQTCEVQAS